ncbi:myelin transcription factor protein [Salix suchowensis]|nr:myelin transcription factor protein [Salix suchowensis]
MKLQNKVLEQMASHLFFFKIFSLVLPLLFVLAPVLILAGFLGYGLLSIFLTSTALLLSMQKSVTDEIVMADQASTSPYIEDVISKPLVLEKELTTEEKEEEEGEEDGSQTDEYLARSSPFITSESDFHGRSSTSEDSEWTGCSKTKSSLKSPFQVDITFVITRKKMRSTTICRKNARFCTRVFLQTACLIEILAELNEMNEEENLIEIDISMGSIKCPRFEIEA